MREDRLAVSRSTYRAVAVLFVLAFLATIWPLYVPFAKIRPLVLGMPFSLFYYACLLALCFGRGCCSSTDEKRRAAPSTRSRTRMADWVVVLAVTLGYLALSLVVGLLSGRGTSSGSVGYVAGDRALGFLVLYFVLGASIFSAFAFLGGPGWAYSRGAAAFYILAYGMVGLAPWYWFGAEGGTPRTALRLRDAGGALRRPLREPGAVGSPRRRLGSSPSSPT